MQIRNTGRGALGVITVLLGLFTLIGCSSTTGGPLPSTAVHPVVVTAIPGPTTSTTPATTLATTSVETTSPTLPPQAIPVAPPIDSIQPAAPQPPTVPVHACGPGYYVNSSGNCVQDPVAAPEAPSGATAQCGDGTYSFSQHRSGTCSHHNGVQRWL